MNRDRYARRYPRTLEEAFGHNTSSTIEEPDDGAHWCEWVVLAIAIVCASALLVSYILEHLE